MLLSPSANVFSIASKQKKWKQKDIRAVTGIVSRDFGGLQMNLMDRIGVPDVSLDVYLFLNFRFHIVIQVQSFERVKLLLMHLANA